MNKQIVRYVVLIVILALLVPPGAVVSRDAAALHAAASSPRALAAGYMVNTTQDESGPCTVDYCSLRQAIEAANANPGPDVITFNIPTDDPGYAGGQWTISLSSPLPALSDDGTVLDASTQPASLAQASVDGMSNCPMLKIVLNASGTAYGFNVTGANAEITDFMITGAATHGVYIHGSGARGSLLLCNHIVNSGDDGIRIGASAISSTIGTEDMGNLISGSGGDGIEITNLASHNFVVGNYIGTDTSGTSAWSNSGNGVHLSNGAMTNTVGLTASGGGNLISGNALAGVLVASSVYTSHGNVVLGNTIGTHADGNVALPNQDGVVINGAWGNILGDNLISGNTNDGVRIEGSAAFGNWLEFNTIGTNRDGDTAIANGDGVVIKDASRNSVGPINLISGNTGYGVLIQGSTAVSNTVSSNNIGINEQGRAALANQDGVVVDGGSGNLVGADNVISGNKRDGVRIQGNTAMYNVVMGNYIGTNADGDDRVSNQRFGVVLHGESNHSAVLDNLISGNGYQGDYTVYGGVGILESDHNALCNNAIGTTRLGGALPNGSHGVTLVSGAESNHIGEGDDPDCANTIAWNKGDGIYVHGNGSFYNTIARNAIHSNDDLGINNESNGNRQLPPPTILKYETVSTTYVRLEGRTCLTCTVQVYEDEDGEGCCFKDLVMPDPSTGRFNWEGSVSAYYGVTMHATDADGNTSEFSASPVRLNLSIDDALPHVAVNKVPGDVAGPAISTTVEYVAHIVSPDPTLTDTLQVDLLFGSGVLGSPVRVFYRDQLSDYDGTPVSWYSPSANLFRVMGVTLKPDQTGTAPGLRWERRVVFRFEVPPGASPTVVVALGTATAPDRSLAWGADWAALRLLKRVNQVIITNRTLLYSEYDDQEATTFLQNLHAFAQGSPANSNPQSTIYYVDAYTSTLAAWDNTAVSYTSELSANDAALRVDGLLEDWLGDSTTIYQKICAFKCYTIPVDYPQYLLIAGDDNVVPFYRRVDGSGAEKKFSGGAPNTVLDALRKNNYFFTDNYYADFSEVNDTVTWSMGGVELNTGRLIGATASDMSVLLQNGQSGPSKTRPAQAIVGSCCSFDGQNIASRIAGHGYNVFNDTETPDTVDADGWQESTLLGLMQGDYQVLHHGNHANEGSWCTPPCDCGGDLDAADVTSSLAIRSRMANNRPVITSNGCRAGLSSAVQGSRTVVNTLTRYGPSAVVISTGITWLRRGFGNLGYSEKLLSSFWHKATQSPSAGAVDLGGALTWAKRLWGAAWGLGGKAEKTTAEFVLYGVPWVTVPYRVGSSPLASMKAAGAAAVSSPQATIDQTYVVTATFDASDYSVDAVDGFDLVEVEGMSLGYDDGKPLVPLAELQLQLPLGSAVVDVEAIATDAVDLGTLNIPAERPAAPIVPNGDPGGLEEVPPEVGVYPPQPAVSRTVSFGGYNLVWVYASPLTYNAATDQATLYQDLVLRITYRLSSTVGLLGMTASPTDLAPDESFSVVADLINAGDQAVQITGTLRLENDIGQVVAVQSVAPFTVPAGEDSLELGWTAPVTEGNYSVFLELWHDGALQVIGRQVLGVSAGRITELMVPEDARPGQGAVIEATFANRGGETFTGRATLSIYTAQGALITRLEVPVSVDAGSEGPIGWVWDTTGMPTGTFVAAVEVTDEAESVTYGIVQKSFELRNAVFLPLVLR